jgi:hypothetical protein
MRLMAALVTMCSALMAERAFTAKAELDAYYGNWGAVYYPRVKWQAKVPGGKLNGFGFVYRDRLPGPFFANHPLTYTPTEAPWFSVRTETGGVKTGYFFQVGPQANLQAVKPVGRLMQYAIMSYLPKFGGIRVNNWVVAGATKEFSLGPLRASVESYERFFPERGIGASYGEIWLWLRPKRRNHFLFAPIVRNNKGTWMFGGGVRYTFPVP